mgnify:FL=1
MNHAIRSTVWWRRVVLVLLLMALLLIPLAVLAQGDAPPSTDAAPPGLEPGVHVTYEQQVPINVVFVGYERSNFKLNDLKGVLPGSYEPVVRYPRRASRTTFSTI